jgi:hypothetical protein
MSCSAQQIQNSPIGQPATEAGNRKIQKAFSVLQLASSVTLGLFFAGVVIPGFLRSGMATNHALAVGSLRALTIGRVTLLFTLQNLASAVLGGLFGALMALAIEFPGTLARATRIFLLFRRIDWMGLFRSRQAGRPGYFDERKLA